LLFCSVAKTTSQGTPESGNRSVDKCDQMKSYNQVASKLVYNQSTIPAFGNTDAVQPRDAPFANKAADAAVVLVQKGHSGPQSSEGPGDLDCDSDDLPGELVKFYLVLTSYILKEDTILEHLLCKLLLQKSIEKACFLSDNK
jgi:BRCA1-associated RING domain protein 1